MKKDIYEDLLRHINEIAKEGAKNDDKIFAKKVKEIEDSFKKNYNRYMEPTEPGNAEALRFARGMLEIALRDYDERITRKNKTTMKGIDIVLSSSEKQK